MASKTALLAGAGGLTGGHCLQFLLGDPAYSSVIALVRKPLQLRHPKLTQHTVDFSHLELHASVVRGDDLFCCLGTTIGKAGSREAFRAVDFGMTVQAATVAQQNGATQVFVVSSMGADPDSRIFYNRVKGEMERELARIPFKGIHFFRPSLLLGEREEFRLGERIAEMAARVGSFVFTGPLEKYKPIQAETVARAMVSVARENRAGTHVYLSDEIQKLGSLR